MFRVSKGLSLRPSKYTRFPLIAVFSSQRYWNRYSPQKTAFRALKLEHPYKSHFVQMFILKCLLWTSVVQSQDLKLSGWVSCSEWSCEKPIQEGIARLNFIGVKECSKIVFETVYGTIKYSSLHVTETSRLTNKTCCLFCRMKHF